LPERLRRRNSLISALCTWVVVAECPVTSGAMIAARAAIQQGRGIAVLELSEPGYERARGGTELLRAAGLACTWDGSRLDELLKQPRPVVREGDLDRALRAARSRGTV
jgi:predicted Rossmann fold nucleotide-binding protein DprA/Smf involved in DNA uptake